ncbi:MAG: ABC transporter substrate-binding protein [Nitrososphaerota archaeon]|nr:ABC transporter substrate-binding protein [Nitrososphaerota archaeon]
MRRVALIVLLLYVAALAFPSAAAVGGRGVVVVDSFGRVVEVPEKPARIISLAPSITETLFAMGLGDMVVGVTSYCNYPPLVLELVEEGRIQVVGEFVNPSLEKIVALDPDLVFAHNLLSPELVEKIEGLGIPVVAIRTPESIDEIYQMIMLIGRASWEEKRSTELVTSLISKTQFWRELTREVKAVDAAYIVSYGPIWVAGSGTYISELIEFAGGRNAFSDKNWWTSISEEELVARDPSILIASDEGIYEALRNLKEKGLIHGEIKLVSQDPINRPGPRVVDALEELVKAIHPQVWSRVVETLSIRAPREIEPNQPVKIVVEVRNPGLLEGVKSVELRFGGEVYFKEVYLKAGESGVAEFEVSAEGPGAYLIESGTSHTICYVREKSREEEMISLQQSLLKELAEVKSRGDLLRNELGNLASAINAQAASVNGALAEIKNFMVIVSAISVASLILLIAVGVAVAKSRRSRNV